MRPAPLSPLPTDVRELLTAARKGDPTALGELLDCYRIILTRTARLAVPEDLRGKFGGSDLVQQTFLDASRDFHQFQGDSEQELLAWLNCLLQHTFANELRRWRCCAKRQVNREVNLHPATTGGETCVPIPAPGPSPCQEVMHREMEASLREAVAELPDLHREVLHLRYSEKRTFPEIASQLGMSSNAVRKLCIRALDHLGKEMNI